MPAILAFRSQRQRDHQEFKVSLGYIVNVRITWGTVGDPISKTKQNGTSKTKPTTTAKQTKPLPSPQTLNRTPQKNLKSLTVLVSSVFFAPSHV